MDITKIRNIAIIAHVDHGKTTIVDYLLKQSHTFQQHQSQMQQDTIMDSNDLERERGVTILAKNTAIKWQDYKINILDTPGHADFAGEVERVLSMADGCILLVDAAEGALSQTRYVLSLALKQGLKPIVVINKVDRKDQRAEEVISEIGDLFLDLASDESQLDFPVIYAIGREGIAGKEVVDNPDGSLSISDSKDLTPLFKLIIKDIPSPACDLNKPLQMQVTTLDYDTHKGRLVIGRIHRGKVKVGQPLAIVREDKKVGQGRVEYLYEFYGLDKKEIQESFCGDIVAISGVADAHIGDTITDLEHPSGMSRLEIAPPTLKISLSVSTSPFVGEEGKFSTSRHIENRLQKELATNVSLKIEPGTSGDSFLVSGRGELHLSVLIETMRREGFEFSVAKPEVIFKNIDGQIHEPWELLNVSVPSVNAGYVINGMGVRKAKMLDMQEKNDTTYFKYEIPTRNLLGLRQELLSQTSGMAVMHSQLLGYKPKGEDIASTRTGAIVSIETGQATAYSLDNMQKRGVSFVNPGEKVYKGMIIGQNAKMGDLYINVCKGKKLTNMRAAAADSSLKLAPATKMSLEQCLVWLNADELLEVTPKSLRLRKKDLNFKR